LKLFHKASKQFVKPLRLVQKHCVPGIVDRLEPRVLDVARHLPLRLDVFGWRCSRGVDPQVREQLVVREGWRELAVPAWRDPANSRSRADSADDHQPDDAPGRIVGAVVQPQRVLSAAVRRPSPEFRRSRAA
jgi:hypothetical protein